jgi:hypothetical protein
MSLSKCMNYFLDLIDFFLIIGLIVDSSGGVQLGILI